MGKKRPKGGLIWGLLATPSYKISGLFFFTDCQETTSANEHVRKYSSWCTMDGLAATAKTARKIDDFHSACGGLRPQTPNAHLSNKSRFTFTDTQFIVLNTKKILSCLQILWKNFFNNCQNNQGRIQLVRGLGPAIQRWQQKLCKPELAIELRGFKN